MSLAWPILNEEFNVATVIEQRESPYFESDFCRELVEVAERGEGSTWHVAGSLNDDIEL
jgi:hypothetical protein